MEREDYHFKEGRRRGENGPSGDWWTEEGCRMMGKRNKVGRRKVELRDKGRWVVGGSR